MKVSIIGLATSLLASSVAAAPGCAGNISTGSFDMARKLVEFAFNVNDTSVWDELAEMTDLYGNRMTASVQYARSADWVMRDVKNYPSITAWTENVPVDYWKRGTESVHLYVPTREDPMVSLPMLGLGQSVGTGPGGIEANVIPVSSFEELEKLGNATIAGNIVLYNADFVSYGDNSKYRFYGAQKAEAYGAVGALVQSITGYSLVTPHTGTMDPSGIPAAAISVEDSKLITRMYNRHQQAKANPSMHNADLFVAPKVKLVMNAQNHVNHTMQPNIIMDIKGSEKPEEIVIISGHFDSWDVGVGAMDDGAGAFCSYGALKMISRLPRRPKRTVRVVMWNNEESFSRGADGYFEAHKNELDNHVFAMESDIGNFEPWGMQVNAPQEYVDKLSAYGQLLLPSIGGGNVTRVDDEPAVDISPLCSYGIPCGGFEPVDKYSHAPPLSPAGYEGYFRFHHTDADRMDALDKHQLRRNAAAMAVWAYVIADE
ncbi:Carboxypeptidase Q [Zancudomyces culisetae]|uniref:Peptide hydrolase n=1 Tax=Zancudomyces culisetae TaxID=1213189 RepID=A0A1R1PJI6_ZANCU|nr:Carboxypeptidase Q [Zancudomyces culisetae]|eukprot:OMH81089.1 Carboxypeptidase Q [Zancudomyces culisetae]